MGVEQKKKKSMALSFLAATAALLLPNVYAAEALSRHGRCSRTKGTNSLFFPKVVLPEFSFKLAFLYIRKSKSKNKKAMILWDQI